MKERTLDNVLTQEQVNDMKHKAKYLLTILEYDNGELTHMFEMKERGYLSNQEVLDKKIEMIIRHICQLGIFRILYYYLRSLKQ